MKRPIPITTLFLDIGGVLLSDGWDHHARQRAATLFKLKWAEMEQRHSLNFDTYEEGKLTRTNNDAAPNLFRGSTWNLDPQSSVTQKNCAHRFVCPQIAQINAD